MLTADHTSSKVQIANFHTPQKRKRSPKAKIACDSCRTLKLKCDQNHPCSVCARNKYECIYREKRPLRWKNVTQSTSPVESVPGRSYIAGLSEGPMQLHRDSNSLSFSRGILISSNEIRPAHPSLSEDKPFVPIAARPPAIPRSTQVTPLSDTHRSTKSSVSGKDEAINFILEGEEHGPNGFGEVNKYTSGTEFYGPAATLAFLTELRSRARSFQMSNSHLESKDHTEGSNFSAEKLSIVNYFQSEDNRPSDFNPIQAPHLYNETRVQVRPGLSTPETSPAPPHASLNHLATNTEIEKECIRLYFTNLHLIYNILDKDVFLARCEREMWASERHAASSRPHAQPRSSRFPALYNAVVAVGAITAGDETTVLAQNRDKMRELIEGCSSRLDGRSSKGRYLPLELARVYFAEAKNLLGNLFESSSLESTQTLLLMSIFCQYALKPHECYMYSGMAVRSALAIGCASERNISKNPLQAVRTWWILYYHEMEVCCSLGRETFLREPTYYPVYFARFPDPMPQKYAVNDNRLFFARANTELANILKRTSEDIYHSGSTVVNTNKDKYRAALKLDESLILWKSQLSPAFEFDNSPLTAPETVTKRKIVLKLRFYSARILIHRPFLVAAAHKGNPATFAINIRHCLEAAQKTIDLLYETFVNRPFFRTWWYNTTYAFNAIIVILYAIVSHSQRNAETHSMLLSPIHTFPTNPANFSHPARLPTTDHTSAPKLPSASDAIITTTTTLLASVSKCLKIFEAMDGIAVARRCAQLTQEIFDVAKTSVAVLASESGSRIPTILVPPSTEATAGVESAMEQKYDHSKENEADPRSKESGLDADVRDCTTEAESQEEKDNESISRRRVMEPIDLEELAGSAEATTILKQKIPVTLTAEEEVPRSDIPSICVTNPIHPHHSTASLSIPVSAALLPPPSTNSAATIPTPTANDNFPTNTVQNSQNTAFPTFTPDEEEFFASLIDSKILDRIFESHSAGAGAERQGAVSEWDFFNEQMGVGIGGDLGDFWSSTGGNT